MFELAELFGLSLQSLAQAAQLRLYVLVARARRLQLGDDGSELSTRVFTDAITTIAERITAIYLPPRWLPTPGSIS